MHPVPIDLLTRRPGPIGLEAEGDSEVAPTEDRLMGATQIRRVIVLFVLAVMLVAVLEGTAVPLS